MFRFLLLLAAASHGNVLREETSRSNCKDTANGAKDPYNDGCEWYDENPRGCGKYDDGDFKSNDMCCSCGGGSKDGSGGSDVQCGIKPNSIVGGSEATAYSLPWQVALVPSWSDQPYCGGTLIGPQHVLTAAHCMGNSINVMVGEHDSNSNKDGVRHKVCGTTSHPSYNTNTLNYDYAIVRLSKPVEFGTRVAPACLPDKEAYPSDSLVGKSLTVSGWGRTIYQGNQSPVLKTIEVPGISASDCKQAYGSPPNFYPSITDAMLCAQSAPGGEDGGVCQGDSGGPLTFTDGLPAREFIVGVVSWGANCGKAQYPGVYARVTHVRDWIDEQMAIKC